VSNRTPPARTPAPRRPRRGAVSMVRRPLVLPTYPPHEPDRNPLFFVDRNNQAARGDVYPVPFTDRLTDRKVKRPWDSVQLQNEYLEVTVLPALGGRVYAAQDRTNGYDFVYRNNVIKPALIGLFGPWVSGGIEFNWPQHHRPTTFMPVDCALEENPDGSRTAWVGEVEPFNRTKGMVGITLHPGRSLLHARVRLYNRTALPQTFLWWANLAVHVNDDYQTVFPPDIHAVVFHMRRDVASFPVVSGIYNFEDYGEGKDIRWDRNIVDPSSYFAVGSRYAFHGGFDWRRRAGVLHIGDPHTAVGKKVFTWGSGSFGRTWHANLTDADGPYIELMSGVYTDNQPDFSWIEPGEYREFDQYWYPYREIGMVKNATIDAAVSLEVQAHTGEATVGFHATARHARATVLLTAGDRVLLRRPTAIDPATPFVATVTLPPGTSEHALCATLLSERGETLVSYRPEQPAPVTLPDPLPAARLPEELATNEELWINALHLFQYRHPYWDPEPYLREALRRDPLDSRCGTLLGSLQLRRGELETARETIRTALGSVTRRNLNPSDGEPSYLLGVVERFLGNDDAAYAAFAKAAWNNAWQGPAFLAMAGIACRRGDTASALDHLERSLQLNSRNLRARNLKAAILRRTGRAREAASLAAATVATDLLDHWARNELRLSLRALKDAAAARSAAAEMKKLLRDAPDSYLDIALEYDASGMHDDARDVLGLILGRGGGTRPGAPLLYYHLALSCEKAGDHGAAVRACAAARQAPGDWCFPSRLESVEALLLARRIDPGDPRAPLLLGNLYYDKRRYEPAIEQWEAARAADPGLPMAHRNMAIALYERRGDAAAARVSLERAFALDPGDARVLFELVQLLRATNVPAAERLALLDASPGLVAMRDDLYHHMLGALIQAGRSEDAVARMRAHVFHPYEGGEGVLPALHRWAHVLVGRDLLARGRSAEAVEAFRAGLELPESYHEGRRSHEPDAHVRYHLGLAAEASGDAHEARRQRELATANACAEPGMAFWRALAWRRLGDEARAAAELEALLRAADRVAASGGRFGYFDVQPTPLPFENDRARRSAGTSHCLRGMALLGLGRFDESDRELDAALALDAGSIEARFVRDHGRTL
jgi:tetratricopeptide (TPR) repeat protein